MGRKRKERVVWQHRFNLSSDNPQDTALHERLVELGKSREANRAIVETLYHLIISVYHEIPKDSTEILYNGTEILKDSTMESSTPLVPQARPNPKPGSNQKRRKSSSAGETEASNGSSDPTYVPIEDVT